MSRAPGQNQNQREFVLQWIVTQEQHLQELKDSLDSNMKEAELSILVSKVLEHYRKYYEAKKTAAMQDVLQMMAPSWRSPLENAFVWLGGWRPTVAFQIAYAETGRQLKAQLTDILDNVDIPTMASLSLEQLSTISDLQIKTVQREDELSGRMAHLQEALAVELFLSLASVEAAREGTRQSVQEQGGSGNVLRSIVSRKLNLLVELVIDADALRLQTLHQLLKVFTVFQSAQYLVAAGHLQLCIRRIGRSL